MKALLLLTVLGIVGFFVYRDYFSASEPVAAAPVATPASTPAPVPFAIKSAVRNLYEEWKRRELGEQQPAMPEPRKLLTEIRRNLFDRGEHTETALRGAIGQALGEMGVAPSDWQQIATGILSLTNDIAGDERPLGRRPLEEQ